MATNNDDPGNLVAAMSELLENHTYLSGVADYCANSYMSNKLEVREQSKKYSHDALDALASHINVAACNVNYFLKLQRDQLEQTETTLLQVCQSLHASQMSAAARSSSLRLARNNQTPPPPFTLADPFTAPVQTLSPQQVPLDARPRKPFNHVVDYSALDGNEQKPKSPTKTMQVQNTVTTHESPPTTNTTSTPSSSHTGDTSIDSLSPDGQTEEQKSSSSSSMSHSTTPPPPPFRAAPPPRMSMGADSMLCDTQTLPPTPPARPMSAGSHNSQPGDASDSSEVAPPPRPQRRSSRQPPPPLPQTASDNPSGGPPLRPQRATLPAATDDGNVGANVGGPPPKLPSR